MHHKITALLATIFLLGACTSSPDEAVRGSTAGGTSGSSGGAATVLTPSDVSTAELGQGPQPGSQEDLEVNVGDRVVFALNSSVLDSEAQATLDRQAAWLRQYPSITVTLEGHTDERGTRDYNLALGERRAAAVKNYLMASGIDPGRLLTISYGEERPVDPGHDESAWQQNRRAVTVANVVY